MRAVPLEQPLTAAGENDEAARQRADGRPQAPHGLVDTHDADRIKALLRADELQTVLFDVVGKDQEAQLIAHMSALAPHDLPDAVELPHGREQLPPEPLV